MATYWPADVSEIDSPNLSPEALEILVANVPNYMEPRFDPKLLVQTDRLLMTEFSYLGFRYMATAERQMLSERPVTSKITKIGVLEVDDDGNETIIKFKEELPEGWAAW